MTWHGIIHILPPRAAGCGVDPRWAGANTTCWRRAVFINLVTDTTWARRTDGVGRAPGDPAHFSQDARQESDSMVDENGA